MAGNDANSQVRDIHWYEHVARDDKDLNVLYSNGKKRRLLTTGLNGYVIEWNMLDGTVRSKFNANSAIWHS